ncbi:MAG: hypothetical protein ACOY3E_05385 [Pseudomonadota bacterium]
MGATVQEETAGIFTEGFDNRVGFEHDPRFQLQAGEQPQLTLELRAPNVEDMLFLRQRARQRHGKGAVTFLGKAGFGFWHWQAPVQRETAGTGRNGSRSSLLGGTNLLREIRNGANLLRFLAK